VATVIFAVAIAAGGCTNGNTSGSQGGRIVHEDGERGPLSLGQPADLSQRAKVPKNRRTWRLSAVERGGLLSHGSAPVCLPGAA
jgi:hypothetical protein